jgi:hypothetical protein
MAHRGIVSIHRNLRDFALMYVAVSRESVRPRPTSQHKGVAAVAKYRRKKA